MSFELYRDSQPVTKNRYTITVTPAMLSSDTEIGELPLDKRGCLSDTTDYGSKIFNRYSFSKCVYECRLEEASYEMDCHPWDQWLPFGNQSSVICNKYDESWVLNTMKTFETEECEHCLPDCNSTTYAYSVRHEKLEV